MTHLTQMLNTIHIKPCCSNNVALSRCAIVQLIRQDLQLVLMRFKCRQSHVLVLNNSVTVSDTQVHLPQATVIFHASPAPQ